jgi:hypothetical protein
MTPLLFNMRRIKESGGPDKLRYDLIAKTFGQLCGLAQLPPAAAVMEEAKRLDPPWLAPWRRALAEELLLRQNCGKPVPPDWIAAFGERSPLEDDVPLAHRLRTPGACALYPYATATEQPGVGHVWVFGEGLPPAFLATPDRWDGDSWQLAAALARLALANRDPGQIQALAVDWIVTGTCDGERINPVKIGNKLDLDTRRNWLVPAQTPLPDGAAHVRGRIYFSATVRSAFNLMAGKGFQTSDAHDGDLFAADILHSFVSKARLPVLLTALAVQPRRIVLWCSAEFEETGRDLKNIVLPRFLPDCRVEIRTIESRDIAKVEAELHPELRKDVLKNRRIVFNITSGNLIQRLAVPSLASQFPSILLIYRDFDTQKTNLTAVSYATHPPTTWPNKPTAITSDRVDTEALIEYDNGSTPAEKLLQKLLPEKDQDGGLYNGMSDKTHKDDSILIGNSFPLSLARRHMTVRPSSVQDLRKAAQGKTVASFWGHANTLDAAEAFVGLPLAPATTRPALGLDAEGFVQFNDRSYRQCWVLAPDYASGFRPAVGEEVPREKIIGWQVLNIKWES